MIFITLIQNHNTERLGVLELSNNHIIVVWLLNDKSYGTLEQASNWILLNVRRIGTLEPALI